MADCDHLYIRHYKSRFDAPFQIASRLYVGWWGNYQTRDEAEQALAAFKSKEQSDG